MTKSRWRHCGRTEVSIPRRIFRRYADASWLQQLHLRGRWRMCPFEVVASHLPQHGSVLDYGCGHGLFAHLLKLSSPGRVVTGYDPDIRKIRTAQASANGEAGLIMTEHDPLRRGGHPYDGITLIDVIPYLPVEEGLALLRRCYARLTPGGVLLVKDVQRRPHWKFVLTHLLELLAVRVFGWTWSEGRHIAFWPSERFQEVFHALGGQVERFDLSRMGLLCPHVMWRVLKPGEQ